MEKNGSISVGDEIHGFKVCEITPIHELCATFYSLEHITSKTPLIHIACDDEENVFCLAFQTLPTDSTGVAHILEHTVLCGSKKFPVKDPFFGMTRRSLNTFMNALTGSDFTCYPAASCIEKDFYHLLDVYMDAVFHPLLKKQSFMQEGCRLEFEEKEDPSSPLVYRGIVYNEMKGSLASSEARLWEVINKHLMPDLPYSHNSGGDPKEIPALTYENFLSFYKDHYDPTKCLFYFYGNISLHKHLAYLENHLLKDCRPSKGQITIKNQKRFLAPKSIKAFYPSTDKDLSHKTLISFSWLTSPISMQEDLLGLTLLDSLLLDTDASYLKQALLQSGLCRQVDPFVDVEMSEIPFHIICKGCEPSGADKLKEILFSILHRLYETGFDAEKIASSLHQLELMGTEITGDYYPFGLTLFFRSGLAKLHGCDPKKMLLIHSQFQKLIELTKNPRYLPDLMKKYLIDNPHFVSVVMAPDSHLADAELKEEKQSLEQIKNIFSEKEKQELILASKELESFQEKLEDTSLDCLPKLSIEDIPQSTSFFHLEKQERPPLTIYHHDCFTNHFVYIDIVESLPKLTTEELLYTKLFTLLFSELGTKTKSYKKNLDLIHAKTGGIGASLGIHSQCNTPSIVKPAIHIRGKALSRNTKDLFSILIEMMDQLSFKEKERIKEVILQIFTELEQKVAKGSLGYATDLAVSHHSVPTFLHHLWHGYGFYTFMQSIARDLDGRIDHHIQELTKLKEKIFHHQHIDLILSCSIDDKKTIEENNYFGLSLLHKYPYYPWETTFELPQARSHARPIASPVAFSCMGYKTICAPHPDSPYLSVAAILMQNKVLHKKIREQGGAYGAGASYNIINGNFTLYAYRDPHLSSTIKAFEEAIHSIKEGAFTPLDLEEAKFLIIQNIDAPVSPGSRAMDSYAQIRENLRLDLRQTFRDKILQASCQEVANATKLYLSHFIQEGTFVTFCKESLFKKEQKTLPLALSMTEVYHKN